MQDAIRYSSCIWPDYIDKESRVFQKYSLPKATALVISMACTSLVFWNMAKSHLKRFTYNETYNFFRIYIWAMILRMISTKVCSLVFLYIDLPYDSCRVCGFIGTFLTVFEGEAFTHICIERYVIAKYITNGWPINKNHYKLYYFLCLFFSLLYSVPPLYGIGRYAPDFSCDYCIFDMVLPDDWTRYVVMAIWLLRSVKLLIFMLVMLFKARKLRLRFTPEMHKRNDMAFTRIVELTLYLNKFAWGPLMFTRADVLIPQMFSWKIDTPLYELNVLVLPILYEKWPLIITATLAFAVRLIDNIFTNNFIKPEEIEEVLMDPDEKKKE